MLRLKHWRGKISLNIFFGGGGFYRRGTVIFNQLEMAKRKTKLSFLMVILNI